MRVAYLNPTGQMGGAEVALLNFLASLAEVERGPELHLIAADDGPFVAAARELGVSVNVVPFPARLAALGDSAASGDAHDRLPSLKLASKLVTGSEAAMVYLRRLRRALHALKPDLIHTNGFKMHILGLWAKPRRTPAVWHIHDYVSRRRFMSRQLRLHAGWCAAALANSRSVAEDLRRACRHRLRVFPVYNGVDLDRFSPQGDRLDLDALAGLPPATAGTVRVGLMATLARWKGHRTFLEALSLLPESLPVRGYVIGGPIYQTAGSQHTLGELRELADQLGLSGRVGFTGFVAAAPAALRALDAVVHASTEPEPFGMVIAEAMACARAVVVSRAGGAAEIVSDGVNALTHAPGDARDLAARIERLAGDARLRSELGQSGRRTVRDCFDRRRLSAELLPVYRAVAASAN
jgi:glycosyltransferase involved in cell wall biosynthesis